MNQVHVKRSPLKRGMEDKSDKEGGELGNGVTSSMLVENSAKGGRRPRIGGRLGRGKGSRAKG